MTTVPDGHNWQRTLHPEINIQEGHDVFPTSITLMKNLQALILTHTEGIFSNTPPRQIEELWCHQKKFYFTIHLWISRCGNVLEIE